MGDENSEAMIDCIKLRPEVSDKEIVNYSNKEHKTKCRIESLGQNAGKTAC